jgi:hypothetical protein
MPTLITSALGGEADIPRSRSGVRYDPRVDLEENRHVFLIRPSLLRILVSLLLELGRNPPKPLRYKGSLLDVKALSLQIGAKSPCNFPNCRERRVGFRLPAQPPSRGYSGSLPRLTEDSGRSAELRHQLAVILSDLAPESAFQRQNASFLRRIRSFRNCLWEAGKWGRQSLARRTSHVLLRSYLANRVRG